MHRMYLRLSARTLVALLLVLVLPAWIPAAAWSQNPPHVWSQRFGGLGDDGAFAGAVDGADNFIMTGSFRNTADFGGGDLTSAGLDDIFIAKFDDGGGHLWSRRFGGTGIDRCRGVATDGTGNVFVTGHFQNTVNFGGGDLTSAGGNDIFIAKFDADGDHLWSQRFGSTGVDICVGVATDGAGNVFVTGWFQNTVNFGGGDLTSAGDYDVVVAKYDTDGSHLWSHSFGGTGYDFGWALAVDGAGNAIVTGSGFLAKYGSNGTPLWNHSYAVMGFAIATDEAGNVIFTGSFYNTVNLGGEDLTSAGGPDIFVAKYDTDGNHLWSRRFGGGGGGDDDEGLSIATDGNYNVVVAGRFGGSADFGGGIFTSVGEEDMFIAKYNASGDHLWSMTFGGAGWEKPNGLAIDGGGSVLVAGTFEGTVNFGGEDLTTAGGGGYCCDDIFMAKYTQPEVSVLDGNLLICPQGDAETLVIYLDFFDDAMTDDVPADSIVLGDPTGGNLTLFSSGPITADGPATSANGYQTTITYPYIGGCSCSETASIPIRVNGVLAGTAFIIARSPDLDASGLVDATDLNIFIASYTKCDEDPGYDCCADFVESEPPGCVDLVDLSTLAFHWLHQAPVSSSTGSSEELAKSSISVNVATAVSEVDDQLGFTVALKDVRSAAVVEMELAFDPELEFVLWQSNPDIPGVAMIIPRGDHVCLVVMVSGGTALEGESIELGKIGFRSRDAHRESRSEEFELVSGHVVTSDGEVRILGGGKQSIDDSPTRPPVYLNRLVQNYPNPFNPTTVIRFSVATGSQAHLAVYNVKGDLVRTLVDEFVQPGEHRVDWDGINNKGYPVASGVYFYRLKAGTFTDTKKLILLR